MRGQTILVTCNFHPNIYAKISAEKIQQKKEKAKGKKVMPWGNNTRVRSSGGYHFSPNVKYIVY